MRDEIQWIKVKKDTDDIEGLILGNDDTGAVYYAMTTDIGEPNIYDTPKLPLPGRLIGFAATEAFNTRGDQK